ncbi:MAG: response regulator transcription factor [Clostridia bacterium]|nr:response regulator transcription factor [Clostridia bacterium]
MAEKEIFVVDDEKKIRDIIKIYLDNEGYDVSCFESGEDMLQSFNIKTPDMIIIDIMMPGMNGYDICREIRKKSDVPIIIVSAKDETFDKVLGIELGSDDYMVKPFSPRELVVRVKNIFRRVEKSAGSSVLKKNRLKIKDIEIFKDERKILCHTREIVLTTKEFDLLVFLVENANKAFKRDQLIDRVWGYEVILETRLVDDVVKRIRKKLIENESQVEITTVWGYGYKIEG